MNYNFSELYRLYNQGVTDPQQLWLAADSDLSRGVFQGRREEVVDLLHSIGVDVPDDAHFGPTRNLENEKALASYFNKAFGTDFGYRDEPITEEDIHPSSSIKEQRPAENEWAKDVSRDTLDRFQENPDSRGGTSTNTPSSPASSDPQSTNLPAEKFADSWVDNSNVTNLQPDSVSLNSTRTASADTLTRGTSSDRGSRTISDNTSPSTGNTSNRGTIDGTRENSGTTNGTRDPFADGNRTQDVGVDDPDSLSDQISKLLSLLEGQNLVGAASQLEYFFQKMTEELKKDMGLKGTEAVNLAQNLYNAFAGVLNTQLSALYQRENWVFQQSYNNPIAQMERLMAAGINPAFYYGCLGSSNAGEIGSPDVQSPSMNAITPDTSDAQKFANYAQAAASIASIFQGSIGSAGGLVQSIANAKFMDEQRIDVNETRPARLKQMFSSSAMNNASASSINAKTPAEVDLLHAQNYYAREQTKWLPEQFKVMREQMANTYKISEMTLANNLDIANLNNSTQQYVAKLSADAQKYAARMGYKSTVLSTSGNALVSILQNMYDDTESMEYVDVDTGQQYTQQEMEQLHGDMEIEAGGKLPLNLLEGNVKGKAGSLDSFTNGQTFSMGTRKFQSKSVKHREFNPARWEAALQMFEPLYNGLKSGKINSRTYLQGVAEIQSIADSENKKCLEYVSGKFTDKLFAPYMQQLNTHAEHFQ